MKSHSPYSSQPDAYTITTPTSSSEHLVRLIRLPKNLLMVLVIVLVLEASFGHPAVRYQSQWDATRQAHHSRFISLLGEEHTYEGERPLVIMIDPRLSVGGWIWKQCTRLMGSL